MNLVVRIALALSVVAVAIGMSAAGAQTVVRCGEVSEFVAPTESAPGSFAMVSGGDALSVMVPPTATVSGLSHYACVSVVPGAPAASFVGLVTPGMPGYVSAAPTGPAPQATKASEAATSLVLLATALVLFSVLVVFASYGGAWGRRVSAPQAAQPYNDDIRQRPGGVRASHR